MSKFETLFIEMEASSLLTKQLKISSDDALSLIDELSNVHGSWAEFLNNVVRGGNLNVATKEFVALMNDRIRTTLSNQYKIFGDNALRPINEYKITNEIRDDLLDKGILIEDKDGKTMWKFK